MTRWGVLRTPDRRWTFRATGSIERGVRTLHGVSMDLAGLQQLLQRIAGARVVAVGDLMVDRFVYGDVARISPEAPIPVMTRRRESVMLGAAGNVARNVAALGAKVTLVGVVGQDAPAEEARGLVAAEA